MKFLLSDTYNDVSHFLLKKVYFYIIVRNKIVFFAVFANSISTGLQHMKYIDAILE